MYTQTDIDTIHAQYKKRIGLWLIPLGILLGFLVYSLAIRLEWLTSALFAVLCALLLFALSNSILPVRNYRRFLQNAVYGRNRQDSLAFDVFGEEAVTREGVRFYPVTLRADTIKEELDERSFYWDANLPKPDWQKGQRLSIRSHEKMITGWQTEEGHA